MPFTSRATDRMYSTRNVAPLCWEPPRVNAFDASSELSKSTRPTPLSKKKCIGWPSEALRTRCECTVPSIQADHLHSTKLLEHWTDRRGLRSFRESGKKQLPTHQHSGQFAQIVMRRACVNNRAPVLGTSFSGSSRCTCGCISVCSVGGWSASVLTTTTTTTTAAASVTSNGASDTAGNNTARAKDRKLESFGIVGSFDFETQHKRSMYPRVLRGRALQPQVMKVIRWCAANKTELNVRHVGGISLSLIGHWSRDCSRVWLPSNHFLSSSLSI
jgi:hypothetical protein